MISPINIDSMMESAKNIGDIPNNFQRLIFELTNRQWPCDLDAMPKTIYKSDVMKSLERAYGIVSGAKPCEIVPLLGSKSPAIMDVGCGDASITTSLAGRLGSLPSAVYCADIGPTPPEYMYLIKAQTAAVYVDMSTDHPLPIADESIDVVFASMSLHHIEDIDKLIAEIGRVSKKGAVFILREHDAIDERTAWLIHFQHQLYSKFCDGKDLSEAYGGSYFCRYVDRTYWDKKICSAGWGVLAGYTPGVVEGNVRKYWAAYSRI